MSLDFLLFSYVLDFQIKKKQENSQGIFRPTYNKNFLFSQYPIKNFFSKPFQLPFSVWNF